LSIVPYQFVSCIDFLRLAQLFFLFLQENVSFLQKRDQIFTVSQSLSDFRGKVVLFIVNLLISKVP